VASLVVRSSASATRLADLEPKRLAEEADVDVALTGTLLRAGEQIRMNVQLVELPSGTVIWSHAAQSAMSDVFELQDRLTQKIVTSLELPLTEREARLIHRDVPATPRAHEFYLRAGQQPESPQGWEVARDLYRQALEEDPRYAPAWARLSRMHLLLGKYGTDTHQQYELAESAARHAIELNPDLALAHDACVKIEVATGRAMQAMLRLLDRVQKGTNDPEVFAAMVMACRFCGLLEASAAAHEQARRLDPHISTSAAHTYWMMGRHAEALATVDRDRDWGGDEAFVYESLGRMDEAFAVFDDRQQRLLSAGATRDTLPFTFLDMFRRVLANDQSVIPLIERFAAFPDPEGVYYIARSLARLGHASRAIDLVESSIERGFHCFPAFARDPWLDPLRSDGRFGAILRRAEERTAAATRAFDAHPGSRVLLVG
jgi:tetratricopeptide (TPR) repeat protein